VQGEAAQALPIRTEHIRAIEVTLDRQRSPVQGGQMGKAQFLTVEFKYDFGTVDDG